MFLIILTLFLRIFVLSSGYPSNEGEPSDIHVYIDTEPAIFKNTSADEFYLQGKEGQSFQLVIGKKLSSDKLFCNLHNSAKSTFRYKLRSEQFGNTSQIHFILTVRNNGQMQCFTGSSQDAILTFYLFVAPKKSSKYFARISIERVSNSGSFYIACLGTYPTNTTRLWIDGNQTNHVYEPTKGFRVAKMDNSAQHFFECVQGNQMVSSFTGQEYSSKVYDFQIIKADEVKKTILQCIVSSERKIDMSLISNVFISCDDRTICGTEKTWVLSKENLTVSILLPEKVGISSTFHCVFKIKNHGVVVRSMFIEISNGFPYTKVILLSLAVLFGVCGFVYYRLWKSKKTEEKRYSLLKEKISLKNIDFYYKDMVGEGYSSLIYKFPMADETGKYSAVKCSLNKNHKNLKMEAIILSQLNHPNIIKAYGVSAPSGMSKYIPTNYVDHLVFPYYERGSLDKYLSTFLKVDQNCYYSEKWKEHLTLFDLIAFAWQLSSALVHLKDRNITHRDLALRNILVDENGVIKLIDFERSKTGETEITTTLGKVRWVLWKFACEKAIPFKSYPLEALEGTYTYSSDVWAFGIIMIEIFSLGREVFGDQQNVKMYETNLRNVEIGGVRHSYRQPEECPQEIYDELILKCINNERTKRISIEECQAKLWRHLTMMDNDKLVKLKGFLSDKKDQIHVPENLPGVRYVTGDETVEMLLGDHQLN